MHDEGRTSRWRVVGQSVRGAAHERSGLPNQDAIGWLPESGVGLPLMLAVADGHGSARCFRSARGAQLAVETGAQVIHDFLTGQAGIDNLSVVKRTAEEWLPRALVRRWLEAVADDLATHPFSAAELELLEGARGATAETAPTNLPLAYGTTLLTACVAASFILYLQLGDGEILVVNDEGQVSRPLAKDERLFANETTSLCSADAWRDFRISFQAGSQAFPAAILLATDGYSNSFRDETGFLKVGSDILELIRRDGLDRVTASLEGWLTDSTRAGSGDDVTLGIICQTDAEFAHEEAIGAALKLRGPVA